MDALRQWWHDVAAPRVHRARWFLAIWVVLALVAVPWGVRAEERSLEADSVAALAAAGLTVEDITFTGRDAIVSGELTEDDRRTAEEVLGELAGIRNIEWRVDTVSEPPVVTAPPPATTTTTLPPDNPATLELKVRVGRLSLGGRLPDAARVASIASAAELAYRADVVNRLAVGDVVDPGWLESASRLVSSLGLVSDATIVLDGSGIAGTAAVPTGSAAAALDVLFDGFRQDGLPVDIDIAVSEGGTAVLSINDDGNVVTAEGVLYRASLIEDVNELLGAVDDREVETSIRLNKSLAPAFAVTRLDDLIEVLAGAEQWSLSYDDEVVSGGRLGKGLFPRDPEKPPTATAVRLADEIAALMVGDPRLHLTLEVGSVVRSNGSTDLEMARMRADAVVVVLMRLGVDPDRVSATEIDAGEVLRFTLEPAER